MDEVVAGAARRGVVSTRDVERLGGDGRELRRAAAAGRLVRVRHDAYVASEVWEAAGGAARHLVRVRAVQRALPGAVLCRESAAVVWGLPLLGEIPAAVQVLGPYRGGGRRYAGIRHHSTTDAVEVVERGGGPVTTCARTVVDVARTRSFAAGLVAADHALRLGLVTPECLGAEVERLGRRRGARAARRVVAHANGLAESPGESLSRARMIEVGAEIPELQVDVHDARGRIGRVDFWWRGPGLVGEFDGRTKYARDGVDDRRPPEDRLWDEKLREDRIRATGVRVVRWTWADAWDPVRFAALLADAGVPLLP